ncbi:MAG: redoxin domain-containing protein, partial [Planctomycetota bacterium]
MSRGYNRAGQGGDATERIRCRDELFSNVEAPEKGPMFSRNRSIALAITVTTLTSIPLEALAQSGLRPRTRVSPNEPLVRQAEGPLRLPLDERLWHNSPPLSLESLSGKGVVFYFFEEEDPRIVANWPAVQRLASEYDGKPILFVGVNSGTDPRTLKRYLSRQRIAWPVIHDFDRSLENSMGVPKLTPEGEVFAVKYIAAGGDLADGIGADFAATAEA